MGSPSMAVGRNTNAFVPDMVDEEPFLYWDAGALQTATGTQLSNKYSCFAIPNGLPNPALPGGVANTKLQTNMQTANQFPPPRCALVHAIEFQYSPEMTLADIQKVEDGAYWEFKISDKIFFEGWIRDAPAGGGLMGVTTQNGESAYTNGFPAPQATRRFGSWAKYIPPLTRFTIEVFFNGSQPTNAALGTTFGTIPTVTGPVGLAMRVVIDGITALPVQ